MQVIFDCKDRNGVRMNISYATVEALVRDADSGELNRVIHDFDVHAEIKGKKHNFNSVSDMVDYCRKLA